MVFYIFLEKLTQNPEKSKTLVKIPRIILTCNGSEPRCFLSFGLWKHVNTSIMGKTDERIKNQERKSMGELVKLPNIGKAVEEQLNQIGIFTQDDLKSVGAKNAWLKIQGIDESACIHRLLALEGAIRGVKKTTLPDDVKADLKEFYQWHKKK